MQCIMEHINKDIVSCYIGQDLGNHLFRIAATLDYAKKYNKVAIFQSDNDVVKNRWDELFCKKVDIINIIDMKPIKFEYFNELKHGDVYKEIPKFHNNLMLIGSFQSYKYISNKTRSKMRELVYSNEKYMYNAYDEYNKIKETFQDDLDRNFVSIYVKKDSGLPNDYYTNAYKMICELEQDKKHIVVFSDDIEWCKKNLKINNDQYFASFDNKCIELIVMSMFYNNILSNSTYGWWGAYLCNHNEKAVVVPEKWISNGSVTGDIMLPEWKSVPTTVA